MWVTTLELSPVSFSTVTEQIEIDLVVDPVRHRISQASKLLKLLGQDDQRSNERSALTLLALLALRAEDPWSAASSPLLKTYEIMAWIEAHYAKKYAPNSRETIRRFTLHQFIEAGIVVQNPDDPRRPVNSPANCYQVEPRALELIRAFEEPDFESRLLVHLAEVPGLVARYAAARDLHRIPVTLPDGTAITLSPGGQNDLIADIIENFCGMYTPGGQVVYLGDAGSKWATFDEQRLKSLGIVLDPHGKMPDLVVYMPDRNWLVLIEAAAAHGPINSKRYGELKILFKDSTAGLVFISCLPTRTEFRKYAKEIAWETDVWCADNPTHLIHFNGERFLGPYPDSSR